MKFEDKFKDVFDQFEPEVNNSVWHKVNSSLNSGSPSNEGLNQPASNNIGFINKIVTAIKSGSIVVKVAGIAMLVGGILAYNYVKQQDDIKTSNKKVDAEINSPINQSLNEQKEQSVDLKGNDYTQPESNHQVTTNSTSNKEVFHEEQEESIAQKDESVDQHTTPVTNTVPSIKPDLNPLKANQSVEKNISHPTEIQSEISLIVNQKIGFSPLKVVCITDVNMGLSDIDFGDGNVVYKTNSINHTYNAPGLYQLTCKQNGKEKTVQIKAIGAIATAFSPNGDQINDELIIESTELEEIEVQISNRFGKILFRQKGRAINWDGNTEEGVKAESGTYFYNIFATSLEGEIIKQKGTINLFR